MRSQEGRKGNKTQSYIFVLFFPFVLLRNEKRDVTLIPLYLIPDLTSVILFPSSISTFHRRDVRVLWDRKEDRKTSPPGVTGSFTSVGGSVSDP